MGVPGEGSVLRAAPGTAVHPRDAPGWEPHSPQQNPPGQGCSCVWYWEDWLHWDQRSGARHGLLLVLQPSVYVTCPTPALIARLSRMVRAGFSAPNPSSLPVLPPCKVSGNRQITFSAGK